MIPSGNPSAFHEYARGPPELASLRRSDDNGPDNPGPPHVTTRPPPAVGSGRDDVGGTYYPPPANVKPRKRSSDKAKTSSPNRQAPAAHARRDSTSSSTSMPPMGEPPMHVLAPAAGGQTQARRRQNAADYHGLFSPSLPSNLATPMDSPAPTEVQQPFTERQRRNSRHQNEEDPWFPINKYRNPTATQHATQAIQPFVVDSNGVDKSQPQGGGLGANLARHHSTRSHHVAGDVATTTTRRIGGGGAPQGNNAANAAIFGSPQHRTIKLPLHDAGNRRSFAGYIEDYQLKNEGRSASPLRGRQPERRTTQKAAAPPAIPQPPTQPQPQYMPARPDDDDYEDLNSNVPFSDDGLGTPRAQKTRVVEQTQPQQPQPRRVIHRTLTPTNEPKAAGKPPPPATAAPQQEEEESLESPETTPRGKKRPRHVLDYDDAMLEKMTYADLRMQPFDANPEAEAEAAARHNANGTTPLADESLPGRLERCKRVRAHEQQDMFAQMSLRDWESSGDWFLEQFGRLTQKLREARQSKRALVEGFEGEIAAREAAVRARTEGIEAKLGQIRNKGEAMLADKLG